MTAKNPWKTKNSKIVYETAWMKIREDSVVRPDGSDGIYSYVETPKSVFIVAQDADEQIYLIGQYRYPTGMYSWELPGGSTDGEELLVAAKKELKEETGLEATNWSEVGRLQAMNGVVSEIEHVFLAKNLEQTGVNKQNEDGIDQVKKVSFAEILEMIKTGDMTDAQSIAALMQFGIFSGKSKG